MAETNNDERMRNTLQAPRLRALQAAAVAFHEAESKHERESDGTEAEAVARAQLDRTRDKLLIAAREFAEVV